MNDAQQKGSGSTVLKVLGIGCLVMMLLAAGVGYYVYVNAAKLARSAAASLVEAGTEESLTGAGFSDAERTEAMEPIRAFTKRIRDGEVDFDEGVEVLKAIMEGPVAVVFMTHGFVKMYLDPSELPEAEKQQGRTTVSRFEYGVVHEKIDKDKGKEVFDIVSVKEGTGEDAQTKLKEKITPEELQRCLKLMKEAADEAGVEDKLFTISVADEIQKAIDKGMSGKGAKGAP